jgi:hypothetical protein
VFAIESQLDVQLNCTLFPSVRSWKLTSPRAWPRKEHQQVNRRASKHMQTPTTTIHWTLRIRCMVYLLGYTSISDVEIIMKNARNSQETHENHGFVLLDVT